MSAWIWWCSKWGWAGRLDATNVVMPELCVITPVDFDHEALSGQEPGIDRRREGGHFEAGRAGGILAAARRRPRACWTRARRSLAIPVARTGCVAHRRSRARCARQPVPAFGRTRSAHRVSAGGRASGGECGHRRGRAGASWALPIAPLRTASRAPSGRAAWSASRSIPKSFSMARTIPPARARWRHISRPLLFAAPGAPDLRRHAR